MKLKNKKTGEIGYTAVLQSKAIVVMDENAIQLGSYTSLAELNEEWEDYEEPKEYWYISWCGNVANDKYTGIVTDEKCKEIGNYFETVEEAEKAVEKLKAWKRLKDKGFRFKKWESYEETSGLSFPDNDIINSYTAIFDFKKPCRKYEIENEIKADLDLLFSGVEND